MQTSQDRILTTHVGSLPRNPTLAVLLIREERGEAIDRSVLDHEIDDAVAQIVARQIEARVDVINDGEQPRVGFQTYIAMRMDGFGGVSKRPRPLDYAEFPEFAAQAARRFPHRSKVSDAPMAIGEVRYKNLSEANRECQLFVAASNKFAGKYADRFMTAPSPGVIATTMLNGYYDSHERYLSALARELRKEYELIVGAGLVLQIDAPDLAMERTMLYQDKTIPEFLAIAELHVAALNEALANIPSSQVRLHCCWGNWDGPHLHDIPLVDILPVLYQARVGALSLEFANARHQHEYRAFKQHRLPDHMLLLPGIIDSTSNYVEHPEVIADRIGAAVAAVGDRSRVIASTDCGFGTFSGYEFVAPDVVWAKLRSLAAGAELATQRLWR